MYDLLQQNMRNEKRLRYLMSSNWRSMRISGHIVCRYRMARLFVRRNEIKYIKNTHPPRVILLNIVDKCRIKLLVDFGTY